MSGWMRRSFNAKSDEDEERIEEGGGKGLRDGRRRA